MSLRSPLGRALGLGSAKEGTGHWLAQRFTSVALVPLGLWFVISLGVLPGLDHAQVVAWIASPGNSVALLLLIVAAAYHGKLGVQVVVEDYLHVGWVKASALILNAFVFFAAAVAGVFAVLRISFGATP